MPTNSKEGERRINREAHPMQRCYMAQSIYDSSGDNASFKPEGVHTATLKLYPLTQTSLDEEKAAPFSMDSNVSMHVGANFKLLT